MEDFTICNVCEEPGSLENSLEQGQIYSNVRMFKEERFTVWRCSNCLSLHSKEAVDLDHYYAHYPIKNHTLRYATRCAYRNRIRLLKRYGLRKEDEILDFGCGQGLFVSFLNYQGYNAIGYDAFIEEYSDTKILDKTYDIVISYNVIEHVNEPRDLFGTLTGCLKKGGLLLIETHNADKISLSEPERFFFTLHQPYHRHIPSEKALLRMGNLAGLEVIKVYYRSYFDTLYPGVNTLFVTNYLRSAGNVLDAAYEERRPGILLTSPLLIFYGLAGYFFPQSGNIVVVFKR